MRAGCGWAASAFMRGGEGLLYERASERAYRSVRRTPACMALWKKGGVVVGGARVGGGWVEGGCRVQVLGLLFLRRQTSRIFSVLYPFAFEIRYEHLSATPWSSWF